MKTDSPLKDKHILVVDDEPDVLEFVEEALEICLIDKADNYETARQYIQVAFSSKSLWKSLKKA